MREVVLRPRAFNDLEGIWLYTYEKWGEKQAGRYLSQLNEQIMLLANTPERGKDRQTLREGYFSIHVGRHLVFYKFTDAIVGIERVLHDQMDFELHL